MKLRFSAESAATLGVACLVLVPALWLTVSLVWGREGSAALTAEAHSPAYARRITRRSAGARAAQVVTTPAPPPFTPEPAWSKPRSLADKRIALALQLENGSPKRSRELLEDALRLEPKNERALRLLATKRFIDENYDEAQMLAERCTAVNAGNATCARVSQHVPKLGPELKKVIYVGEICSQHDPKNLRCAQMAFNSKLGRGKIDEAAEVAQRIAELSPDSPSTQLVQGRINAAKGEYGEARVLFDWACHRGEQAACFRAELLRAEGF